MRDLFRLDGKVAIITGGGRGLGFAMATAFAHQGAEVTIAEIDTSLEEGIVKAIEAEGKEALFVQCDVSNLKDIDRTIEETLRRFGRLDILVNNALAFFRATTLEATEEEFDKVIAVNLKGPYFFSQKAAKIMKEKRSGSIINMASIAATIGLPRGNSTYTASKGGLVSMTRVMAVEWAPYGIRVNAIAPCQFRTPGTEGGLFSNPAYMKQILDAIPLGRVGEPEDIMGPAIFLASDASTMVTGQVLHVDGGVTIS